MSYELRRVQIRPPRVFKPKDVGRISRYCRDDGSRREEILVRVLAEIYPDKVCEWSTGVSEAISLVTLVKKIAVATASSAAIQALIVRLSSSIILKIPVLNRIIIATILILSAVQALMEYVEIRGLKENIEEVAFIMKLACEVKNDGNKHPATA